MNTKIIVALVIGIAVAGLIGAASAGYISTYTDITATHFTSVSRLSVSGVQTEERYEQEFIARFKVPTFPPIDLCYNNIDIQGDQFSRYNNIQSAPTGSRVISEIDSVSAVSGTWEHWDCAMWGAGEGSKQMELPQPISGPGGFLWDSGHPAGVAYPAHSTESHDIHWP